ncbi:intermediate cleaving peptidase 55 [Microdochium nivale]|nr:intermediate cleaving peptidase 55 [Microdochium nivale]
MRTSSSTRALRRALSKLPPRQPALARLGPSLISLRASSAVPPATRSYASTAAVPASELLFGQPVHETHPHILQPGELTPGISAQEYHERRAALCRNLPPNSAVLLPSAAVTYRSGAVFHPFRQESNFLYLTGFSEPDSLAVLRKTGSGPDDYIFHLFCRPKNLKAEQWTGPWSGLDAARDVWNADEVADIARIEIVLPDVLSGVSKIYTDAELTKYGVPTKLGNVVHAASNNIPTAALRQHANALRAIKSPAEIANMRHAGQESGRALTAAMGQSWKYEKDLAAFLEYQYQTRGLDGHAYIPVVAGGSKALLIHYVLNNGELNNDELILVDSGGEYGTYITDITRTWPASGKFSAAQRDLYSAVLKAQRSSVSLCRASADMTLDKIHHITDTALREQLLALGFQLKGNEMSVLFPHHVGHYVGLDVHDIPGYSRAEVLREGHCVTIEPGIYVPDDDRFPTAFRGLGVRIEDSVCVGDEHPLVLTTEAVKEIDDIEALRN